MAKKKTKELTEAEIKARQEKLAKEIRKADITEVAHKLKDCVNEDTGRCEDSRFAVFLGAGASFQSNIKTAGQMMTEFREKILKRNCPNIIKKDEQEKWLKENVFSKPEGNDYSKLFEAFERTPTGRHNYVSKIIKDKKPSFGYAMLASMIARGFVNTILTTNFDDLMFIACNKFTGVRPVIYAYGIMATEMKFSVQHSKILKMHGDYLYSALANTENEMKVYNQDPNMKSQVTHALNEYELIIFGYSGSDNSVMEVLENYPEGKELYWCHWSQELPSVRALELLKKKDGTLVAIEGFDDAMYEIYKVIEFEITTVLAGYEDRRIEIIRFIDEFDKKYSTEVIKQTIEERIPKKTNTFAREPETWWEYFEKAVWAEKNNKFEVAESYYRRAIELNQNHAESYNNLAILIAKDDTRFNEAESLLRKAIQNNSESPIAYSNLGNLISKDKTRFEEAEQLHHKAIKLKPDDATSFRNLGILLGKDKSKFEESEKNFNKAIDLSPKDSSIYMSLGNLYANQDLMFNEAENSYKKAIALDPNNSEAFNNLGLLFVKDKNRFKEAEDAFNQAIAIDPSQSDAHDNLGTLYSKLKNDFETAEKLHRKAIELKPKSANAHNNLGVVLSYDKKRIDEAEVCYRKSIEIDKNFAKAYYNLGVLLIEERDDFIEAEKMFRKVIAIDSNNEEAYNNLAALLAKDNICLDFAEKLLLKALKIKPDYAESYLNLSSVYGLSDKIELAEEMCKKAIKLKPNYGEAYYILGLILAKNKIRISEARKMFLKSIEIKPDFDEAYFNLGVLLEKNTSNQNEAEKLYRQTLEINPTHAGAYNNLGNLFARQKKINSAIDNIKKAIELEPNEPNFLLSLAIVYRKNNDLELAKKYAEDANKHLRENDFYYLACYYAVLDNKDLVLNYLEKAIRNDSTLKFSAKTDNEFDFIRDDERFKEIVGRND